MWVQLIGVCYHEIAAVNLINLNTYLYDKQRNDFKWIIIDLFTYQYLQYIIYNIISSIWKFTTIKVIQYIL